MAEPTSAEAKVPVELLPSVIRITALHADESAAGAGQGC